ncbi:MAG: hypothetical protein IIY88_01745 [Eubacterium sp.]|nr:hypothetical protein [Eubacterium sp.]
MAKKPKNTQMQPPVDKLKSRIGGVQPYLIVSLGQKKAAGTDVKHGG